MKRNDVIRLIVTAFVTFTMVTGCTNSAEKKAKNERNQLSAERAKVAQLQKDTEVRTEEVKRLEADLKSKMDALASDRAQWDQDRSARELEITEMSKTLSAKKAELAKAQSDLEETNNKNKSEVAAIEEARRKLEADQKAVESQIATIKASTDTEVKNRLAGTEETLAKIKADLAEVDRRDQQVKESEESAKKLAGELEGLKQKLAEGEKTLQANVQSARELLQRKDVGDAFDRLQQGKKMKFLVSIVGRGTDKYIEKIQNDLSALTGKKVAATSAGKKDANQSYTVEVQTIVDAEAGVIRKFRDDANEYLEAQNKSGVSAAATSLFVVARPIQKIRIGMKMTVNGSRAAGFDDRTSGSVMELNQIRAIESKVYSIDEVDLNNPGAYVFANDAEGRKCTSVEEECLRVLKEKGLLSAENMMMIKQHDGISATTLTNKDALADLLQASVDQMNMDLELYEKGLSILSYGYSVEDDENKVTFDKDAAKKLAALKFPMLWKATGEARLPIVDGLELSYRIVMIDEIGNAGNPIDTWKYMTSGVIQNVQMFSADRRRSEIEIQLPIGKLTKNEFRFQDLSLKDLKIKAVKPVLKVEKIQTGQDVQMYEAMVAAQQTAIDKKYAAEVRKEKVAEYKKRLRGNMGMQLMFIKRLNQ